MAVTQINLMGSMGNCLNERREGITSESNVSLLTVMELTRKDYFYPMEKRKRRALRSRGEEGVPYSGRCSDGCDQSSSEVLLEGNCYAPIHRLFL